MNVGYLIVAHNQPLHFNRLVKAIVTPHSAAFVHIDAKTDITPFERAKSARVHFIEPRVPVYWGEYSMVEAVLNLMRAALNAPTRYDYLVLISGSDYPIRPPAAFENFLERNAGLEFINVVAMPNESVGKPLSRLQYYRVLSGQPFTIPLRIVRRLLIHARLLPLERDFTPALNGSAPFGGSSWWALTRNACQYILDFVEREREFVRFFRNTWFPDETMVHTILGNSPFAGSMRRNVTYTDWNAGGAHPGIISAEHVRRFTAEPNVSADDHYGRPDEVFFARKFRDDDAALVDQLDAFISKDAGLDSVAARTESAESRPAERLT